MEETQRENVTSASFPPFYLSEKHTFLDGGGVVPSSANRTSVHSSVVVFNRVPKCGSSTMNELLRRLSGRNGFEHNRCVWPLKKSLVFCIREVEVGKDKLDLK